MPGEGSCAFHCICLSRIVVFSSHLAHMTTHCYLWQIRDRTRPSSAEMLGEGLCGTMARPWRSGAMGPHRLLATSDCDIGIEYLIEIVCDRCMFWGSLYVWGLFPRPDPRRGRGGSPDAREDIVAARELLISEARLARLRGLNQ